MSMSREDPARPLAWEKLLKRTQARRRPSLRRFRRRKAGVAPGAGETPVAGEAPGAAAAPRALPSPTLDPRRPIWTPSDADLEFAPPEVRQMIPQVIEPAYEQFVLQSTDGLERWIGSTFVHLLWLETLHQLDLKREYGVMACIPELARVKESEIALQLRVLESKMKIGNFLLRIREARQRLGEPARWPMPQESPPPATEAIPAPPSGSPELEDEASRYPT